MPVDTRDKRFSMLNLSMEQGRVVPNPNGAINTSAERAQWALSYARGFFTPTFRAWWAQNSNKTVGLWIQPE